MAAPFWKPHQVQRMQTFDRSAQFYDAIYAARGKSYGTEAARVRAIIKDHGIQDGANLLDVACGTAEHLSHLESHYDVTGLDASAAMLRVARTKLPGVTFHKADMCCFSLDSSFEIIICLFSAIGYLPNDETLAAAIRQMANHLRLNGLLVIEPAINPEEVVPALMKKLCVDSVYEGRPASITRTASATRGSSVLHIRFDYEIRHGHTTEGTIRFVEYHPMLLVSQSAYARIFEDAGLKAEYVKPEPEAAGLYLVSKTGAPSPPINRGDRVNSQPGARVTNQA